MKKIPGHENYSITEDGRVWTHRLRSGWMRPTIDRVGYVRFNLDDGTGKKKGMYAHRLVALAYIPNPDRKPYVNHKDHNKANNSIDNLEWCTHAENIQYDWSSGRRKPANHGETNGNSKVTLSQVLRMRDMWRNGAQQIELSELFGISQPTVSQIVLGKTWRDA